MAADSEKIGIPWSDAELDLIVGDYFAMLGDELAGRSYVKSHHSAAVMEATGRTHRSVEFKHQNISAVLDELGMPWIAGYKPKRNYQNAIFDAIDRYLSARPAVLSPPAPEPPVARELALVFVDVPDLKPAPARPPRLELLVRKFDPAERDHRNRALGRAGESFVLDVERQRLAGGDRPDLARKVRWVAAEDGDGAGYDILSFETSGAERLIEVKTTNGAARTPFYMTRTECEVAAAQPGSFRVFRVHLFAQSPRIFTIAPPLADALHLRPESFRASFG